METPVLNKKQQKQSLSAKKTKNKETIKNVLSKPYLSYWPQTNSADYENLKSLLESCLPCLKEKVLSPPYDEIKNVPKDQRKIFRQKYTEKNLPEVKKKTVNEGLICGTNAVTRMLESNPKGVGAVLIKENVIQRLLVQHVIDICILYKVPFAMVQNLNQILSSSCGIGAVCCALRNDIPPESNLNLIKQAVGSIDYPIPENHVNYNRSFKLEDDDVEEIRDTNEKRMKQKPEAIKVDEVAIRNSVYLKRTSRGKRAFIPPDSQESTKNEKMDTSDSFLSLSVNKEKNSRYIPLVVKRIKGDVNRNKRKIKSFKK